MHIRYLLTKQTSEWLNRRKRVNAGEEDDRRRWFVYAYRHQANSLLYAYKRGWSGKDVEESKRILRELTCDIDREGPPDA